LHENGQLEICHAVTTTGTCAKLPGISETWIKEDSSKDEDLFHADMDARWFEE